MFFSNEGEAKKRTKKKKNFFYENDNNKDEAQQNGGVEEKGEEVVVVCSASIGFHLTFSCLHLEQLLMTPCLPILQRAEETVTDADSPMSAKIPANNNNKNEGDFPLVEADFMKAEL